MNQLTPFDKAILRTPCLSFDKLQNILEKKENLLEFINQDYFLEAIFVASPNVYNQLTKVLNKPIPEWDRKFYLTIVKYIVRMATRATPFGLFSRYSILPINQSSDFHNITLTYRSTKFHLLDGELRYQINFSSIEDKIEQLNYIVNPSVYLIKNEIRFLKKINVESSPVVIIERINANIFLQNLIKKGGKTLSFHELVNLSMEFNPQFEGLLIRELILIGFLLPIYGHNLTNYNNVGATENADLLPIFKYIHKLNMESKSNHLNLLPKYIKLKKQVSSIFDYAKSPLNISLRNEIILEESFKLNLIGDIKKVIKFLSGLNHSSPKKNIIDFKSEFVRRYNKQKIPFLLALDPDVGIGYSNNKLNSLTGVIPRKIKAISPSENREKTLDFNESDELLLGLLINAKRDGKFQVDISHLPIRLGEEFHFPPTFSASVYLVSKLSEVGNFLFNYAGGENANKLHGRLSIIDEELIEYSKEIANYDTNSNQEYLYAEILFEPNPTLTNVLVRPKLYEYEIPIFSNSNLNTEKQIRLNELSLFIKGDKLILWSETHQKEVIPCLSCAHNYLKNYNLPIYEFLCEMQFQYNSPFVYFSWGKFSRFFNFLPRATYENIILSPAKWSFITKDIKDIFNDDKKFNKWREDFKIPSDFFLSNSENDLFISLNDKILKDIFIDEIKKMNSFQLKEFLIDKENPIIKDSSQKFLSNELIINFKNEQTQKTNEITLENSKIKDQTIDNNWIYVKLYVGTEFADSILKELLLKINKELYMDWFFIRYWDSDFHLRIRFKSNKLVQDNLFTEINKCLSSLIRENLIWKIQYENYEPEVERYSSIALNNVEELFCYDSEFYINVINNFYGFPDEKFKIKFAIQNIFHLVDDFSLTDEEKYQLFLSLKKEMFKDQNITSKINIELKKEKSFIQQYLNDVFQNNFSDNDSISIYTEANVRSFKNKMVIESILSKIGRERTIIILKSVIHMNLNRCFSSNQNLYEAFIYDQFELFQRRKLNKSKY